MDVRWQAADESDLDAWVEALAAIEAVDRTGEVIARSDLEAQSGLSYFDPAADARLAFANGRVVAWGTVCAVPNDRQWRVVLAGSVVPDARGIGLGRELLAWQIDRGRVVAARRSDGVPAWLELSASAGDRAREGLFRASGFAPLRWYHHMRRPLPSNPAPPVVGDGLRLCGYDAADPDAVRAAHNDAFRDHFAATELDAETWQTWMVGDRHFCADASFLVLAGAEIAGYVLNAVYPEEWDGLGFREGWTNQIGVRRAWRGRGVAKALLGATAGAFVRAGLDHATLEVDAENPTGALGLYESLGYRRARTRVLWSAPVV